MITLHKFPNQRPMDSKWMFLIPVAATSLFMAGCETTGNPYDDSFFWSSTKADVALISKKEELNNLHAQINAERDRIAVLKRRLSTTGKTNSELQQRISRLDAEAISLQSKTVSNRYFTPSSGFSAVKTLRRHSEDLNQQITELEKRF